jgi:hypothetical protein
LPDGFADSVLRRAEQTVLKSKAAVDAPRPAAADPYSSSLPRETWLRIWIAMAVAATALFVVVLPDYLQRQRPRGGAEVALSPEIAPPAETFSPAVDSLNFEHKRGDFDDATRMDRFAEGEARKESGAEAPPVHFSKQPAPAAGEGGPAFGASTAKSGLKLDKSSEDRAKDGAAAKVKEEAEGLVTAPVLNFVYDVPSPEAQQFVLKKFEQTLREQQIELEEPPVQQEQLSARFGGGGMGGAPPARRGLGSLQSDGVAAVPEDRVYVVEGTQLQVSNTISSLNSLAAPQNEAERVRQLRDQQLGQKAAQQQAPVDNGARAAAPAQRPADPASQLGGYGNNALRNRSQARRLPTYFYDEFGYEAGRGPGQTAQGTTPPATTPGGNAQKAQEPAKTAPAPPAPTASRSGQAPRGAPAAQQPSAEANPAEKLQRAVIIFRVVPPAAEKATANPQR